MIDGRARRLQRRAAEDEGQQRELGAIRGQVARLTHTVRQLLDYSRPSAQSRAQRHCARYSTAQ
ncbi:hypothetical protein UMZ34_01265 [Halopseudomonas pachastrellae]|nr:hypothetical protein UMZ34_01265 [Halopseudomonas pachastrellae]